MNTSVHFSSKTDNWATPQWLFDQLNEEFHFTLDVCADPQNAKCARYFTREQDGLSKEWDGTVWCNPPYGRTIGLWVKKVAEFVTNGGGLQSCFSLLEPTLGGFMTIFMGTPKSVFSEGGCVSEMLPKMLPSPA